MLRSSMQSSSRLLPNAVTCQAKATLSTSSLRRISTVVASSNKAVSSQRQSISAPRPSPRLATFPSRRPFSSSPSSRLADSEAEKPLEMSSGEEEIHTLLSKRFSPSHLQVQDVSGGCGSFYAIVVASKEFQGLSTVKQHRLVNETLKDIIGGIHGLQVSSDEERTAMSG